MSTNNQASQTLFRFVSLRSPQLSDDKGQDKRFVLAPKELKDAHFYKYVLQHPNELRIRSLNQYAETYSQNPECITDKDYLKSHFPELYEFSAWVARNKDNYTEDELKEKVDTLKTAFDVNQMDFHLLLWNNLIYQVVTQKDFYIKETVMQMLLALHIAQNFDVEKSNVLVNARIVLPKDLMMDTKDALPIGIASRTASGESVGKTTPPSEIMQKMQKVSESKDLLNRFNALKKNLSLIEKQYNKEYQAAYKHEEENYKKKFQPEIDKYNQEVEEARRRYCEIRNPEIPYNPEDPCNKPDNVPYPNIPPFEFEYKPEVDSSIKDLLKPTNLDTFLYLFDYDFSDEKNTEDVYSFLDRELTGIDTFADVYSLIQEKTEKANKVLLDNIIENEETYTSVGGVILPVTRVETIPFTYQLCPQIMRFTLIGYRIKMNLSVDVPDSSWDIVSASYTTNNNFGIISGNTFSKTRIGNKILLSDLFSDTSGGGLFLSVSNVNYSVNIELVFSNGKTTSFTATIDSLKSCYSSGFDIREDIKDPENPENPTHPEPDDSFIPSGFGFKQIGIADYLKVEQTTHAYVEGEVAHIENVMAREYREKSTRRLRRSENTSTTSSDTEREKLTDTTTATRFEMQSEIAKMAQEAKDSNFSYNVNAGYKKGDFYINGGIAGGYANHSSKEESTRQATTQAQDITARALDRVVTKVHEERIEKIIEEFEENNKHGFDNTKGDKHVVGVFRWVDKLMKNQIFNYGKRLMFEFMIPQPAKLHTLGMKLDNSATQTKLVKPTDPRESTTLQMSDYSSLENETILKHWTSKYNVDIDEKPLAEFSIGKSVGGQYTNNLEDLENMAFTGEIQIPDGYVAVRASAGYTAASDGDGASVSIIAGDAQFFFTGRWGQLSYKPKVDFVKQYSKVVPISTTFYNEFSGTVSLTVDVILSQTAKTAWQQKTFKAIIEAYENALAEYENKVAQEQATGIQIKGSNPGFYRQIENTILRKNCISYMIDRTANSTHGYGMSGITTGSTFTDYETDLTPKLDKYTAFLKFMEQAFEWENLSYYLYPYYWANKTEWTSLYQQEDTDPLFRAFLQSGMARVVATVRPGFEDAVQFYMATGKIWNGGEVPVIGDPLYLSIVDEMKEPKGEKQGKAWITRLPTPLNILQAESIGLKVQHALPFSTENPDEFEVPSEVITQSNFEKINVLMETSADKQIASVKIDGSDINFITAKGELVTSLSLGDLANAERPINNIRFEDKSLLFLFKDEEVMRISLEELRNNMGI